MLEKKKQKLFTRTIHTRHALVFKCTLTSYTGTYWRERRSGGDTTGNTTTYLPYIMSFARGRGRRRVVRIQKKRCKRYGRRICRAHDTTRQFIYLFTREVSNIYIFNSYELSVIFCISIYFIKKKKKIRRNYLLQKIVTRF